jgi:hypothetical protein
MSGERERNALKEVLTQRVLSRSSQIGEVPWTLHEAATWRQHYVDTKSLSI